MTLPLPELQGLRPSAPDAGMPEHQSGLCARLQKDVRTVPELLQARARLTPDLPAQAEFSETDSEWHSSSWAAYQRESECIANGLRQHGLTPGARVGIMAHSSSRWDRIHLGVLAAGGVVVGLDPHDLDENLNDIARRCDLAGLVIQNPEGLSRFSAHARDALKFIVWLDSAPEDSAGSSYEALRDLGQGLSVGDLPDIMPDDPATIIFTSGTTGTPKGIPYSHRQLCLAVASIMDAFPDIDEHSRLICWLPLSNMFQRVINLLAIGTGGQTYYVENPRTIMQHVASVSPYLFIGVPRFYEKLYAGMLEHVSQQSAWQRVLVDGAIWVGDRFARAQRAGRRPGFLLRGVFRVADVLVLSRLRAVMGSSLRYMISGSAPMPGWLLERFHAIGLLVLEAYGMSENVIPVAANRLDSFRFGTVGQAMTGCEVKIADDSELLVRGPGVLQHYLGEEDAGLQDADGFLPSGDYARVDADGYITLLGRKSEIIKTATGRRIAPAQVESYLLQVDEVEHAAVFGAGHPFLVAVVSLKGDVLSEKAQGGDIETGLKGFIEQKKSKIVQAISELPAYKRPAALLITARPFTLEGGELTANLKLRRRKIAERYGEEIEALYRALQNAEGGEVMQWVESRGEKMLRCSL